MNPAMLFIETTAWEVILICITSFVGIFAVSAALEGYILRPMTWYQRIICAAGGLLLIYPGWVTDLIGLVLVAAMVALQLLAKNAEKRLA